MKLGRYIPNLSFSFLNGMLRYFAGSTRMKKMLETMVKKVIKNEPYHLNYFESIKSLSVVFSPKKCYFLIADDSDDSLLLAYQYHPPSSFLDFSTQDKAKVLLLYIYILSTSDFIFKSISTRRS